MNNENLGPAERIIQSVLTYTDHAVHNRPGIVVPDARTKVGVRWDYATYKVEGTEKIAYRITRDGKKTIKTRAGVLRDDNSVFEGGRIVGEYREPGLFPEVVAWMYQQVADIWKLDNEFSARWASYQFTQEHRDLKVVLAAFMLVQSRKGDPVVEGGKVAFHDDDFRDVGEAMMLIYKKEASLNPKLLLRIRDVLEVLEVAKINRDLGFTRSAREPALGRWTKVVTKWLKYREENPKLLEGLVKAGFRQTVITLCKRCGYKPETEKFFQVLRWKQSQAKDGRRGIAIGKAVAAAESWEGLTEEQICEKVVKEKVGWKRLVSLVPTTVGITRAVMAAAIESGSLSDKDLIIATPTIEELGLMQVQEIKTRWETAIRRADDMRAANIAGRVKSKVVKEKLEEAADNALKKAAEEVMKGMRVYVFVDRSGSMQTAIEAAIRMLTKLLPAFPADKVHVSHFNTVGTEVSFKSRTAAGVANAFKGVTGSGGTDYGSGIKILQKHKPTDDEDTLFIFVGDQEASQFAQAVVSSGLRPMAFGLLYTPGTGGNGSAVEVTAAALRLPCFRIAEDMFNDPYAVPRTIRALIGATPVGATTERAVQRRVTLAETILKTDLLAKPVWA
jgi:hypothetical protein